MSPSEDDCSFILLTKNTDLMSFIYFHVQEVMKYPVKALLLLILFLSCVENV